MMLGFYGATPNISKISIYRITHFSVADAQSQVAVHLAKLPPTS